MKTDEIVTSTAPEIIPPAPEPVEDHGRPVVHDGVEDRPPASGDDDAEADRGEALIREVMPLVFTAQDDAARFYATPAPQSMRLASATTLARALLFQRGVEGDRLEHLADVIGRGVCDEEGDDPDAPQSAPEPPTLAELATAARVGRERIAEALAALATATGEESAPVLARIAALRDAVSQLEAQLPDSPAFAADAELEAGAPVAVEDVPRVHVPRPAMPSALIAGAGVALVAVGAMLVGRSRPGREG